MSNILITSGTGFIGSNLTEALLEKYPESLTLQVGDIRNLEDCQKATEGIDYVFHEAALGSVPRSIKDPITSNEVNVSGFLIIDKARSLLNYNPEFSMEKGLKEAVKWYWENL